jgi:hypothetical protein
VVLVGLEYITVLVVTCRTLTVTGLDKPAEYGLFNSCGDVAMLAGEYMLVTLCALIGLLTPAERGEGGMCRRRGVRADIGRTNCEGGGIEIFMLGSCFEGGASVSGCDGSCVES